MREGERERGEGGRKTHLAVSVRAPVPAAPLQLQLTFAVKLTTPPLPAVLVSLAAAPSSEAVPHSRLPLPHVRLAVGKHLGALAVRQALVPLALVVAAIRPRALPITLGDGARLWVLEHRLEAIRVRRWARHCARGRVRGRQFCRGEKQEALACHGCHRRERPLVPRVLHAHRRPARGGRGVWGGAGDQCLRGTCRRRGPARLPGRLFWRVWPAPSRSATLPARS